jgi:hypothetical protein
MHITITRRPIGEAPEWVRDAWIGLSLPTVQKSSRVWRSVGVLTGPHTALAQLWAVLRGQSFQVSGYAVKAKVAVDLLAETQPAAAEWWRQNAPKIVDGRSDFIFDADACECLERLG